MARRWTEEQRAAHGEAIRAAHQRGAYSAETRRKQAEAARAAWTPERRAAQAERLQRGHASYAEDSHAV